MIALLAPYALRITAYALVLAALGGGFLYVKIHYENIGYNKAIAAIAAKDERAIENVKKATQTVDDCFAGGHTWNTLDGVCQ